MNFINIIGLNRIYDTDIQYTLHMAGFFCQWFISRRFLNESTTNVINRYGLHLYRLQYVLLEYERQEA